MSYELETAIRGPVGYGPTITHEGEVVPDVSVRLYRRADLSTVITELESTRERKWSNQLNEPGSGSFVMTMDDSDLALFSDGDVVRFEYVGHAALSILVRERNQVTLDPNGEASQQISISGPGTLAILDEALVYPSRGVDQLPIQEDRVFNWTATDYDDSAWGAATEVGAITDTEINSAWYWIPERWAAAANDTTTHWLWGPTWTDGEDTTMAQPGSCYFRKSFTLADATKAVFYGIADDQIDLYIDGVHLLNYVWRNEATDITSQILDLSAGTHVVAIAGANGGIVGINTSPAGIAASIHALLSTGPNPTPLLVTDSSWKMLAYPPQVPGMTPGEVLRHVIEEAQTRGALSGLTLAFSDTVDSDGIAWPIVADIATKVGTDILALVREMTATYIDVAMSPGEWRLYAYNSGGQGSETSISLHGPSDVNNALSTNIAKLTHKRVM